jgi:hypothetical protein
MLFVNSGSGLAAVVLFVLGVAVALALGNLRYHEIAELRASMKRNLGDRRVRAINNLRLRRACGALAAAENLVQVFDGIVEVLESGEFVRADVELNCNGHGPLEARALGLDQNDSASRNVLVTSGGVQWSWRRDGNTDRAADAEQFWVMRLPLVTEESSFGHLNLYRPLSAEPLLVDINYLTNDFQPAVTRAAERIFARAAHTPRQMAAGAR